jgi:hypothetical protein
LSWWIDGHNKSTVRPLRGGNWKGYDFKNKSLINQKYDYQDGVDKTIMLGKSTLFQDFSFTDALQNLSYETSSALTENVWYDDWVKRYCLQNIVNVIISGNEQRYAGMQINVSWPSGDKKREIFHKQLRGVYLIKSITHNFMPSDGNYGYQQRMVLIKNAYQDSDVKKLLPSTLKNIYNANKINIIREG